MDITLILPFCKRKNTPTLKLNENIPQNKIQPAIENYLGKLILLHWNHSIVYDLVLTTKECQPAGWHESFFVLRRWKHMGFTEDSHCPDVTGIVIKLKISNFLGLLIRFLGNTALMTLVLPHFQSNTIYLLQFNG